MKRKEKVYGDVLIFDWIVIKVGSIGYNYSKRFLEKYEIVFRNY